MLECYITSTGSFLPGDPVDNESIANYLGEVAGELRIKEKVLKANGIKTRHYALGSAQNITHSPYELAAQAVQNCLKGQAEIDYLSAGSTHTPLLAPGLASLLHDELSKHGLVTQPLEINSNSGICSSGAQALVNASRAVKAGDAATALCVGVEQPSANFRSTVFHPPGDPPETPNDLKNSAWFMSTFLRFMLSDGAGAFLLEAQPKPQGLSLKVDWTYSRSFANEAPLCMHLPSQSPLVLSQDVKILSKYMAPLSDRVVGEALGKHNETLDSYAAVLPHMSSYYFERSVKKTMARYSTREVPYWTNLQTAGNTGAASIYIMLDEYLKTQPVKSGDRLLLFVPESGQFNYVLISLTVM
jgi:3-oxoacyl-[acyl-carrier-protein] synthase III